MSPHEPSEDSLAKPGRLIAGRFRIETLLGRGGMAAVYRVCDERTGAQLGLKHLLPSSATRARLITAQFEREYYTLCQLVHPRIVSVYDYGVDDGRPFYTMELLDGEDLGARRKLPWPQVCALLCDVASSLAIIHSRRLLHRDISHHNVRRTSDGHAKLIDFGALTPIGSVKQVVGTPPYVSPEALQLQALDARTDLYALGVLAYFLLTGYFPYHTSRLSQLKTLWRSLPYGPARYHKGLPLALDDLVMQMLDLDRTGRPASAAEVMERLSGIAGLPLQELPEVRKAYVATPMLIGRQTPLDRVRQILTDAQRGQGACVLIEGPTGMGRSRVLDACVLEAKLQGPLLLRADATDGGEDYSLVQVLCAQLMQQAPDLCEQSAGTRRALIAHVVPELAGEDPPDTGPPDRQLLQAALCDFIASVAAAKPLVIAIDDLDKVDEASAAVLGGLAHRVKPIALCLILTLEAEAAPQPALGLIRTLATRLSLDPLSPGQTEMLLRSVFGDVAHVVSLSERVHRVTEGNPRWMMTVAEQLVEQGVARYEAGSWALPATLPAGLLPQFLATALWRRLARLPPDARELGEALALTNPTLFDASHFSMLIDNADAARVYQALDALVAGRILVPEGSHYRFGQSGIRELLRDGLDADRARLLHARIARALEHGEHRLQLAYHRMCAGDEREALSLLLPIALEQPPLDDAEFQVELAERALETAERLGLPLREQLALREWLLSITAVLGMPLAKQHGLVLVAQYDRDSGLSEYRAALAEPSSAPSIGDARLRAQQRYDATPEPLRGAPPDLAVVRLAQVCVYVVAFAAIAEDGALLDELPSLSPLSEQMPQLAVVRRQIEMQKGVISGCSANVLGACHEIIGWLDRPDHAGFSVAQARSLRLGMVYVLGLYAAGGGQAEAREWVAELQRARGYRANAWRVRMVYELMQGNPQAAIVCQRRAELLQLQESGHARFPETTIKIELLSAIYAEDLLAVKRVSERLETLAASYPNWERSLRVARSHYRRLQGDASGALDALAPALETSAAGRHADWSLLVAAEVAALSDCGRHEEAMTRGRAALAKCLELGHWASFATLLRSVARATMVAQHLDEALELMTRCLQFQEEHGPGGIALALSYEVRCQLAIAMRDQAALQHYFELCAEQFAGRREGALTRKYERLRDAAEAADLALSQPARSPLFNP